MIVANLSSVKSVRRALLLTTCLSVGAAFIAPASAQQQNAASDVEEIVVTGSRIVTNAYEAPTPVAEVSADALALSNPISVSAALIEMPQLVGSVGASSGSRYGTQTTTGNFMNLRDLTAIRTLVLMDGRRLPSTSFEGTVDADTIPSMLIKRVDVVTGGVSAVYGSDAVSGVVNFVLDSNFTGVKMNAQTGISEYGDNFNYTTGIAAGFTVGEKTHIVASVERYRTLGFAQGARSNWQFCGSYGAVPGSSLPAGNVGNPFTMSCDDVRTGVFSSMKTGHPTTAPFADITFTGPRQFRTYNAGTITGTTNTWLGGDNGWLGSEKSNQADNTGRWSGFFQVTHDFADWVQGAFSVNATHIRTNNTGITNYSSNAFTIYQNNAFLVRDFPTLNQRFIGTGTAAAPQYTSFTFRRGFADVPNIEYFMRTWTYNFTAGFKGDIEGFKYDLSFQHAMSVGKNRRANLFLNTNFAAAVDAVFDPATGNIVCRPQLSTDAAVRARYADCVPINPFGYGSPSAAAARYVTNEPQDQKDKNLFDSVQLSITRELFDLPAGTVAMAFGGEYRRVALNFYSNADPANPLDTTGLRGVPGNVKYNLTNPAAAKGTQTVKEGFAELNVPLIANKEFAQSLDFNGAVRVTDYKTSGTVVTWKTGLTWAPIDDVRFRGSLSRDIRAPTLYDLNLGLERVSGSAVDAHTGVTGNPVVFNGGNINLVPEKANTWAIGAVVQPSFIDNFTFSVDYYNIHIKDAIIVPTTGSVIDLCELSNGTAPVCDNIVRPFPFSNRTPANFPTTVRTTRINAAGFWNSGLDIDATWRTDLGEGSLTVHANINYTLSDKSQNSVIDPIISNVGVLDARLKGLMTVNYKVDDFGVTLTERMVGPVDRYSATQWYSTAPSKPVFYSNISFTWDVRPYETATQIFFNVTNVFGAGGPLIATGFAGASLYTLPNLYNPSIVGRTFNAGIKVNF